MKIKVSVVLPVYNVEKYLEQCIESLINQSLQDIEIVCVDDGSTDSSLQILRKYEKMDHRLKVISQENQYAGVARNNGMKIAKGEYLAFLDSDDFFELDMLERVYNRAIEETADIVMYGARKYNDVTHQFEEAQTYFHKEYLQSKVVFNRKDFPTQILSITTTAPWTKLYKRSFIENHGIKFQSLQNANDVFFTLMSVSLAERITWVDGVFVNYRIGLDNDTQNNKEKKPCCFIEAYRQVFNELNRRNIYSEIEKNFVNVVLSSAAFNIKTLKTQNALREVYKGIGSNMFSEMHLMDYPKEYYSNTNDFEEVLAANFVLEQMKKTQNRKNTTQKYQVLQESSQDVYSISVVIPVYNVEKYIDACLNSIVNQTFKDIEIICVNDGTKDDSMQIVNLYAKKDNRFKIIQQTNQGLSAARNHGIKEAKGKYIYFMDSDDILDLNALEELIDLMSVHNLDIIYFDAKCFSEDDEGKKFISDNHLENNYIRNHSYDSNIKGSVLFKEMVNNKEFKTSVCLQFYKKDFLLKQEIFFHEGVLHEDNTFTLLTMLSSNHVGYINKPYFNRRYRANSIMTKKGSFDNSYGYFMSYIDFIKKYKVYDSLDEDTKECLHIILKGFLRNSRNIYARLSNAEKKSYKGLDYDDMRIFDVAIVESGLIKSELIEKQKKLQTTYDEKYERGIQIKELQAKLKKSEQNEKKLSKKADELNKIKHSKTYKIVYRFSKIYRNIVKK